MAEVDTVQIPTVTQPTIGETVATMSKLIKSTGVPTDAKSTATDATSVTFMQVFKQISASVQALVTAIGSTAWDLGSGTSGSRTQRVIIDSGQLAGNQTTAQAMAAGFQLTDPPTDGTFALRTGSLTETAPATDTASSGLNGRLQRIAQRVSTLITNLSTTGLSNKAFSAAFTTLTRAANTTAYTAGDSISDNATPASVTALSATVSDTNDDPIFISDILIKSTDTGLAGKRIRAYLYNADPTASTGVVGGDNLAFSNKINGYIGSFSGRLEAGFSDGTVGRLVPSFQLSTDTTDTAGSPAGGFIAVLPTTGAKTIFIQYQAIDGFTPSGNSTTIIARARGWQGRAA